MDASFVPKRPLDPTIEPPAKRRHHLPPPFSTATSSAVNPASKHSETVFRLLCPAAKAGALVGKGGVVIRHLCELTGAKIYVDDSIPSDERIVIIVVENKPKEHCSTCNNHESAENRSSVSEGHTNEANNSSNSNAGDGEEGSLAQKALVRVFEKMARLDEEEKKSGNLNAENNEDTSIKGTVVCRLLVPSNQVGCVIGRGGKIVEKIRQESGAHVRVLPKDHSPPSVPPGDELIQMTGNFMAVKKALLSVSCCLQDNPRADAAGFGSAKPSGLMMPHGTGVPAQTDMYPQRGYTSSAHSGDYRRRGYPSNPGPENMGVHRGLVEEEVVFKLLCQGDKVGNLIGKGGSVIRGLQGETGASIKVADAIPNSDERIVIISARENSEQRHSPAQDTVMRVHNRITEIGFEPGAAVVARLLVHSQQVGYLVGKGGCIISEMRRATGTNIRIFPKEQVPKYGYHSHEVVQVIGNVQSVQDALFHITGRLRETIFPVRPSFPSINVPPYPPPFPEMPPPQFRPVHNPTSPGPYPSPVGHPIVDSPSVSSQSFDHQPAFSVNMDRIAPNSDRVPYAYGCERQGHGPAFDRPSSPRSWNPQAYGNGNPRRIGDTGSGMTLGARFGSGSHGPVMTCTTVEIVIPQAYLIHVFGENKSNLSHIRQISGANVVVYDAKPGAAEGLIQVSGTSDQKRAAQSLIHGFILSGQSTS